MRLIAITLALLAAATLVATVQADDTPQRSPELQVLDRFVGTWDHELTVKSPEGEGKVNRVDTRMWSPGGNVLIIENSKDSKASPDVPEFYMILTYDPEANQYPGYFMSGTDRGFMTGTWDEKTTTMRWKGKDAKSGNTSVGEHRFIGKNRAVASLVVTNPDGDFVMEFTWKQTRRTEAPNATDAKADEIVAKYLNAIGGDKALKKLTTRKTTGTLAIAGIGGPWNMTVTQKAPNLKHVSIEVPDVGVVTEGFDGKVEWKREPGSETRQLAGEEFKQKQREGFFYKYTDLKSQYKTLTYEGRETVKGKEYDVLAGIYEDGAEESIYIDVKTNLIGLVRSEAVTIEVSDYREVDGVQLAFSWVVSLGAAEAVLTIELDTITHGVNIDDAIFAMPTD